MNLATVQLIAWIVVFVGSVLGLMFRDVRIFGVPLAASLLMILLFIVGTHR